MLTLLIAAAFAETCSVAERQTDVDRLWTFAENAPRIGLSKEGGYEAVEVAKIRSTEAPGETDDLIAQISPDKQWLILTWWAKSEIHLKPWDKRVLTVPLSVHLDRHGNLKPVHSPHCNVSRDIALQFLSSVPHK